MTPRFSLSCTDDLLASCASLLSDVKGARMTSDLNENLLESTEWESSSTAVTTSSRTTGTGSSSVGACSRTTCTRPMRSSACLRHAAPASPTVPTSNSARGSGHFPLARHVRHGVRVALGADVGAGSGSCMCSTSPCPTPRDAEDALAKAFTLGTPADLETWVDGVLVGRSAAGAAVGGGW